MSIHRYTRAETFSGLATWQSNWVELATPKEILTYNIAWTAVAATDGLITLEGTNDPAKASTSIVTFTTANLTLWGTGFTVSTTAGKTFASVEGAPHFARMVYTRTAGGGAGQFSLWTFAGHG